VDEMARNKPAAKKKRLAAALRANAGTPTWVVAKTLGKKRWAKPRHWRRSRMQL